MKFGACTYIDVHNNIIIVDMEIHLVHYGIRHTCIHIYIDWETLSVKSLVCTNINKNYDRQ